MDITSKGGFALRQWASIEESLISDLVKHSTDINILLNLEKTISTLGLCSLGSTP